MFMTNDILEAAFPRHWVSLGELDGILLEARFRQAAQVLGALDGLQESGR
jgi:hypothetical protein